MYSDKDFYKTCDLIKSLRSEISPQAVSDWFLKYEYFAHNKVTNQYPIEAIVWLQFQ